MDRKKAEPKKRQGASRIQNEDRGEYGGGWGEGWGGFLKTGERRRNEAERTSEVGREFISRSATWSHQRLV